MLVVGDLRRWERLGRDMPDMKGLRFVGFAEVTAEILAKTQPDIVLSALVGDGFDALDLARRLSDLNYGGRYRAVTLELPNPHLVTSEVRACAPGLDFDIYVIDTE